MKTIRLPLTAKVQACLEKEAKAMGISPERRAKQALAQGYGMAGIWVASTALEDALDGVAKHSNQRPKAPAALPQTESLRPFYS